MRLGIDFDNTIVSYRGVFHRVAVEGGLIPPETGASKDAVRDFLRSQGREDDWIELQGLVYGARMDAARAYEGAQEFIRRSLARGMEVFIISHRTRHPYMGPDYDLHEAARRWLGTQRFFEPDVTGLAEESVFFELTKEEKLDRIGVQGCDVFIDDLPEFLGEAGFPDATRPFLFDPDGRHAETAGYHRIPSWAEAEDIVYHDTPEAA